MMIVAAQQVPKLPMKQQIALTRLGGRVLEDKKRQREKDSQAPIPVLQPVLEDKPLVFSGSHLHAKLCSQVRRKNQMKVEGLQLKTIDNVIYAATVLFEFHRHKAKDHANGRCPKNQLCQLTIPEIWVRIQMALEGVVTFAISTDFEKVNRCNSLQFAFALQAITACSNIVSYRYAISLLKVNKVGEA